MRDETLLRFPGLQRLLSSPVVLSDRLLDRMDAPLGIGEAHERIRIEQLIEVGDDSMRGWSSLHSTGGHRH
ncbi:hypothetical protein IM711_11375 [Microbacterium esteraromaticum]|uniref:hypothetical protein n=1 Tax=Microbacterium esteraromaticum TaxID=57043 RepID=UPI003C2EC475